MKYYTLKIDWNHYKDKYDVTHRKDDRQERVENYVHPHSLGFFHYPEIMSDDEAFNMLVNKLIKDKEEEIEYLNKMLEELKFLNSNHK